MSFPGMPVGAPPLEPNYVEPEAISWWQKPLRYVTPSEGSVSIAGLHAGLDPFHIAQPAYRGRL